MERNGDARSAARGNLREKQRDNSNGCGRTRDKASWMRAEIGAGRRRWLRERQRQWLGEAKVAVEVRWRGGGCGFNELFTQSSRENKMHFQRTEAWV
jgi:hypothetical protein